MKTQHQGPGQEDSDIVFHSWQNWLGVAKMQKSRNSGFWRKTCVSQIFQLYVRPDEVPAALSGGKKDEKKIIDEFLS